MLGVWVCPERPGLHNTMWVGFGLPEDDATGVDARVVCLDVEHVQPVPSRAPPSYLFFRLSVFSHRLSGSESDD